MRVVNRLYRHRILLGTHSIRSQPYEPAKDRKGRAAKTGHETGRRTDAEGCAPDVEALVEGARGDVLAVGAEGDGVDGVFVLLEAVQAPPGLHVPQLHCGVEAVDGKSTTPCQHIGTSAHQHVGAAARRHSGSAAKQRIRAAAAARRDSALSSACRGSDELHSSKTRRVNTRR